MADDEDMSLDRVMTADKAGSWRRSHEPSTPIPGWGDRIRSNDDVVAFQIRKAYLQDVPLTMSGLLTGSVDIVVFVDVYENATNLDPESALTSIAYVALDQQLPAMLNFSDAYVYGPTRFKGHPLRLEFTVMVLQKRKLDLVASIIKPIMEIAGSAAPEFAVVMSKASSVIKATLDASPDVTTFVFAQTFSSDNPEGLLKPLTATIEKTGGGNGDAKVREPVSSWDERYPWLRYGTYALIETRKYGAANDIPGTLDGSLYIDQDRVFVRPHGNSNTVKGNPLSSNYLIVTIGPPRQEPQEDADLLAASKLSSDMLKKLRRSQDDINQALKDIGTLGAELTKEVIKVQAERNARRAAKKSEDRAKFVYHFNEIWNATGLSNLPGVDSTWLNQLKDRILERWKAKYDTAAGAPVAGPSPLEIAIDSLIRDRFAQSWRFDSDTEIVVDVNAEETPAMIEVGVSGVRSTASKESLEQELRQSIQEFVDNWSGDPELGTGVQISATVNAINPP